ncbi:metallophosphoesterase [Microlunatus ginsengisoli]|uniref:Calcineurin-like phosphoesterase n=1 Tax=Microlunatus ginsengisoli TaxID=363863 RepID=A0ABP6ZUH2_9ACTN
MRSITGLRGRVAAVIVAALLASLANVVLMSPAPAAAASKCATLTKKVHHFYNAKRGVSVYTYNSARFAGLKKSGYADLGVIFKASSKKTGLKAVHVMYNKRTGDRIYTTSASEIKGIKKKGYVDNGVGFYVYGKSASCLYPVYRFHKGALHRYVGTSSDRAALKKQGWIEQSKVYWLSKPASVVKAPAASKPPTAPKPPAGDHSFTLAVMPDTQNEVTYPGDKRMMNRSQWLVDNAKSLKLAYVTHTGDIVNWGSVDPSQFAVAAPSFDLLAKNGIPYSLTIGNHDTAAVCKGGSACPGANTRATVRDTSAFNKYLHGGVADLAGRYEAGKLDNIFSTFTAGDRKWLMLNLELWPREGVVSWARQVVAAHPDYNVIVATHSYLTSSGAIYTKSDYGATSPQYLYDNLISKYANIKMVLCGHVGQQAHRVDYGVGKNRIDTFMLTVHSGTTNPVRLIQIDPVAGTLKTWVYAPYDKTSYPNWTVSLKSMSFVK